MPIGIKNRRITIGKKPQKLVMIRRKISKIQSHDWSIKVCKKHDIIVICRYFNWAIVHV